MVPAPPEQVAQRVCHVVAALPKAAGVALNPPYVTASIGTGLWSWGEKILVQLSEVPGGSAVRIRSECVFPLQLVDYGKNRRNVEQIVAGLA